MPCKLCGHPVDVLPICVRLHTDYGAVCDSCIAIQIERQHQADRQKKYEADLRLLCPPCFLDTDERLLPCPDKTELVLQWQYGKHGLNLWGWPGMGKTRTMTLILKRELRDGRSVIALGPGSFRHQCERRSWRRSSWLKALARVDLLFLDDMDKMNLTSEMERDLFAVLSDRMGRLPVLSTGNSDGDKLKCRFKLGEPMVDRMRRYSQSIYFPKPACTSAQPHLALVTA